LTPNSDQQKSVIDVTGLRTQFGDVIVHDQLDLSVRRGEILGVVGGSGTGKSVLMRAIIGLKPPSAGDVKVFDQSFYDVSEADRIGIEQRWGILFQGGALFSSMTVAQNVMAPIREHLDISESFAQDIAAMKISMAGLPADAGAKYPSELSGGMKKRAGLARAGPLRPARCLILIVFSWLFNCNNLIKEKKRPVRVFFITNIISILIYKL